MFKRILILSLFINGFLFAQTYCSGDQISLAHQQQEFNVCYGSEEYSTGDSWKLADFNGDLNGGNYHVLFLDMGATW
tara:strand:+ start:1247 stop:1477 length:231 start_codon:yes stop_codon:yes gene_type:complete